jgi:hypothetical protein
MESTKNLTTAMVPSGFGMSACGHAFGAFTTSTGAFGTVGGAAAVVRERRTEIEQDMDLAIAYVPGTSAWSPPPS